MKPISELLRFSFLPLVLLVGPGQFTLFLVSVSRDHLGAAVRSLLSVSLKKDYLANALQDIANNTRTAPPWMLQLQFFWTLKLEYRCGQWKRVP